mgnify:CR=1 FL=1
MSHFAKVIDNIVVNIIVAEQDFIDTLDDSHLWIQTSCNTFGGVHYEPDSRIPSKDQSKALRKNHAMIGGSYDDELDAFLNPKPYTSWILNIDTCLYDSPIPYPDDGEKYGWNENTLTWDIITFRQTFN